MDTSKIDSLLQQQNQLRAEQYDNLVKQVQSHLDDLKKLSMSYVGQLTGKDGKIICPEALNITLFQTNLLENNNVDVYLELSTGKFMYNSFNPDINDYLPQELDRGQMEILLSVDDNYAQAMFNTNLATVLTATEDALSQENKRLQDNIVNNI